MSWVKTSPRQASTTHKGLEVRGKSLKRVGFLGVTETWQGLRGAASVYFDFYGAFRFGTGFAEEGVGGDGFVVNLSNQIGFARIIFFPDLADLDLADRHNTNVDRFDERVNTQKQDDSQGKPLAKRPMGSR
jgi:hypothetical protein